MKYIHWTVYKMLFFSLVSFDEKLTTTIPNMAIIGIMIIFSFIKYALNSIIKINSINTLNFRIIIHFL